MPKSRKRGGQKAHNKRVNARNAKLRGVQKKMREAYSKMFESKMQELQGKFSDMNENNELDANQIAETLQVELPKPIPTQE